MWGLKNRGVGGVEESVAGEGWIEEVGTLHSLEEGGGVRFEEGAVGHEVRVPERRLPPLVFWVAVAAHIRFEPREQFNPPPLE